jgi:hypothetical protein
MRNGLGLQLLAFAIVGISCAAHAATGGFPQPEFPVACVEGQEPLHLNYGEHTTGCAIDSSTDLDRFTFTGTAGDEVRVIVRSLTTHLDPRLEIRSLCDPNSPIIFANFCSGQTSGGSGIKCTISAPSLTLPCTGTYGIFVSDQGSDETGEYQLEIAQILPRDDGLCVDYGIPIGEVVNQPTDVDFVQFQGAANSIVRLVVRSLTNHLDPRLEIRDPAGNEIFDSFCTGQTSGGSGIKCTLSTGDIMLPLNGTYTAILSDAGSDETGSVEINLECIVGNCPVPVLPLSVSLDIPDRELSIMDMEQLVIQGKLVNGPLQPARPVRTFAWIRRPDLSSISIVPMSFAGVFNVPPGFDFCISRPSSIAGTGPLTAEGDYLLGVRLVDSNTGRVLTEDVVAFTVVP